jgi:hypothetical protein
MAASSLPSVPLSLQTHEIPVPPDPLVDRIVEFLKAYDSALLCPSCAAMLRLRDALVASPKGENHGEF